MQNDIIKQPSAPQDSSATTVAQEVTKVTLQPVEIAVQQQPTTGLEREETQTEADPQPEQPKPIDTKQAAQKKSSEFFAKTFRDYYGSGSYLYLPDRRSSLCRLKPVST